MERFRWPPHVARESVLAELERAMAANPAALDTRFYYASFLRDHGRLDEAIAVFEEIAARAPDHVETLVALGVVLARRGRRLDARAVLERAVAADGTHRNALVNLANLLALDDPGRAKSLYEAALAYEPGFAPAHRGLCSLAAARGDVAVAALHRVTGYPSGPFVQRPYLGETTPVCVVALLSTDGGNVPVEALLDERTALVHELYVEVYRGEALPPHELIVNAIADADRAGPALELAGRIVRNATVRVINQPRAVATTGRVAIAGRLAALPDVVVPAAWPVRGAIMPPDVYPLILRVPGLHMGRGMIRIDSAFDLAGVPAESVQRSDLIATAFVDTRSEDGAFRKYRVMAIDGVLYPLHLAIAHHWNVHYFSSEMFERADYRAEEARFLADPVATIGRRAWEALGRVRDVLGLDYAGIDFALDAEGRIVVFEANPAMTVLGQSQEIRAALGRWTARQP